MPTCTSGQINLRMLIEIYFRNKAVAEGAISFNIDHSVTSRVSRYTYGVECCPTFDPDNLEHIARAHTREAGPSGTLVVPNGFSGILSKVSILFYKTCGCFIFRVQDTEVSEEREFRKFFYTEYTRREFRALSTEKTTIKCYRDRKSKAPAWIDMAPGLWRFGTPCGTISLRMHRTFSGPLCCDCWCLGGQKLDSASN